MKNSICFIRRSWITTLLMSVLVLSMWMLFSTVDVSAGTLMPAPIHDSDIPQPEEEIGTPGNEISPDGIPSGYFLISSDLGISMYKKNFSGGQPNYVQIINLSQGASVKLTHGSIDSLRVGLGPFGGNDASFYKTSLSTAWNSLSASYSKAFCITNGQFFATSSNPTRLAFPLKKDSQILSDGYGSTSEYPGQILILELWSDHANIQMLTRDSLYNSTAPDILGGLSESANKGVYTYTGRTFAGIDDADGNGTYETVLIFNSLYSRQVDAANALRSFGADMVIMFDGGGSTQLRCGLTNHISSTRIIPQTIGSVAAEPPPTLRHLYVPYLVNNHR